MSQSLEDAYARLQTGVSMLGHEVERLEELPHGGSEDAKAEATARREAAVVVRGWLRFCAQVRLNALERELRAFESMATVTSAKKQAWRQCVRRAAPVAHTMGCVDAGAWWQ